MQIFWKTRDRNFFRNSVEKKKSTYKLDKSGGDIITSHMQKSIQIYPCLLKLSHKQESVTDGQTDSRYYYIPSPLLRGDNKAAMDN